jgi:hypothetical protein
MVIEYEALSPLARAYLAVVAAGLVPWRLAGDETFRIDHVTAVCAALMAGMPAETHFEGAGPSPSSAFSDALRQTIAELDETELIIAGAGDGTMAMLPLIGQGRPMLSAAEIARLDLNQPPKILDTYLAYRALDELLANPRVYPFLMEKYGASSAIWQRLAAQGYGR